MIKRFSKILVICSFVLLMGLATGCKKDNEPEVLSTEATTDLSQVAKEATFVSTGEVANTMSLRESLKQNYGENVDKERYDSLPEESIDIYGLEGWNSGLMTFTSSLFMKTEGIEIGYSYMPEDAGADVVGSNGSFVTDSGITVYYLYLTNPMSGIDLYMDLPGRDLQIRVWGPFSIEDVKELCDSKHIVVK